MPRIYNLLMACFLIIFVSHVFFIGCGEGMILLIKNSEAENEVEEIQDLSGEITEDTTISGNVLVTGDVIVSDGTLTIEPGTIIEVSAENDNAVYGSDNQVSIVVINDGAIQANGTETDPIIFTSDSAPPSAGDWDKIRIIANGENSSITYCIIEYAFNGICIENPPGVTGASTPVIDHVIVRHISGAGIFATDASNVEITNCEIYDGRTGIFFHGAASPGILNTLIYDVGSGIVLAVDNEKSPTMEVTINHITIYNVDSALDPDPTFWTGYGIFTCDNAGTGVLTLTNSIIVDPTYYGLFCSLSIWTTITEDYNCFFGGIDSKYDGSAPVSVGTNSIEDDPLFTDPDSNDFTLDGSSPCIGEASDGLNMGVN